MTKEGLFNVENLCFCSLLNGCGFCFKYVGAVPIPLSAETAHVALQTNSNTCIFFVVLVWVFFLILFYFIEFYSPPPLFFFCMALLVSLSTLLMRSSLEVLVALLKGSLLCHTVVLARGLSGSPSRAPLFTSRGEDKNMPFCCFHFLATCIVSRKQ